MKFSKRILLPAILAAPLALLFSPLVGQASAAPEPYWYNASKTAEMKIIGKAFIRCADLFQSNKQGKFDAKDAQSGNIFIDDFDGDLRAQGLLLETWVGGSYDDFIITCKENDSKLAGKFRDLFGFNMTEITCGPYQGNKGILYRPDDNKECSGYHDGPGGDYEFSDVAKTYAEKMFKEGFAKKNGDKKLFYGDSSVNVESKVNGQDYTGPEFYYIYYETFTRYCAYEDDGGSVSINIVGANGSVETKKFTYKQTGNVQLYQSKSMSCSDLAGELSASKQYFKDARTLEHQRINLACRDTKKYQEILEKKRDSLKDIIEKGVGEEYTQEQIDLANTQLTTIYGIIGGGGQAGSKDFTQYVDPADEKQGWNCLQLDELGLTASVDAFNSSMSDGTAEPNCYNSGGAVAWILCPVMNIVKDAGELMWAQVRNNLIVDSSLLQSGGDGLYKAWESFRSIANVILIIVFLIVIVSQLTGIGISNYGIKKVMPRLVIVAVLINLSFIICQLAVDASNILGTSLNTMLENIVPYTDPQGFTSGDGTGVSAFFAWITAILIGGAGGILLAGGIGPLLGLIAVALIMGVLAILVLFVLLAIRQAGIVVLIALAPVAFACFILPNTEGLFKKWLNLFKVLLILFPISALLVGGATMASNIMLNSSTEENSIMMLLAFVLPAASYFFIPSLLKTSMAGLGNIGAKLSGLGSKFGRSAGNKASNKIQNSDAMKYMGSKRQDAITAAKYGQYKGKNPLRKARSKLSNALTGSGGLLANTGYGKAVAQKAGALQTAQEKEEMAEFMDANRNADIGTLQKNLTAELNLGDKASSAKVRGAVTMLASKGGIGVEAIRSGYTGATATSASSMSMLKNAMTDGANFGNIKAKAPGFMDSMVGAQAPVADRQTGKNALDSEGRLVVPPSASGFDFTKLNNEELANVSAKEMDRLRQASMAAGAQQEQLFNARMQEIVNDDALYAKVSNAEMMAAMGSPSRAASDPTRFDVQRPPTAPPTTPPATPQTPPPTIILP